MEGERRRTLRVEELEVGAVGGEGADDAEDAGAVVARVVEGDVLELGVARDQIDHEVRAQAEGRVAAVASLGEEGQRVSPNKVLPPKEEERRARSWQFK